MENAKSVSLASANSPVPMHAPGFRLRRGQNWFFLGLLYAAYYLCRYNLSIIAPELKQELHLNNEKFGTIQTARDWAYAFGQFINGLFTDRLGGKLAMTMGAIGTVMFNLMFGILCIQFSHVGWLLTALVVVRLFDGYVQAFGAPGMVKINAAWFRREERGTFAGIFGGMIQLGAAGVGLIGKFLTTGTLVILPLYTYQMTVNAPKLGWRYMFFIPPAIVIVITILMNLFVKNHPEEAGYRVIHDDETAADDPHEQIRLEDVFVRIASNPIVWIVALAYFCTGFVRRSIESYWVIWLQDVWHQDKSRPIFSFLAIAIPMTAFFGSYGSGLISDRLFGSRRAPVAAGIYLLEVGLTTAGLLLAMGNMAGGLWFAVAILIGINMTCNSTHSILGTAAPMDLGGRKMSGFALGVIDSFQYIGAGLAGRSLGHWLDRPSVPAVALASAPSSPFNSAIWFGSMLPFGLIGALLMLFVWFRNRGTDRRGA